MKQSWWQGWDQHELSNAEFHPQGWPSYRHCWVSISQQWRQTLSSLRWSADTWWQADYIKSLSLSNWVTSCFSWKIHLLRKWICFPCPQSFPPDYHDCYIHRHGFPHSFASEPNPPKTIHTRLQWWTHGMMQLSKPIECTTEKVNPNINYGAYLIIMWQHQSISCKNYNQK